MSCRLALTRYTQSKAFASCDSMSMSLKMVKSARFCISSKPLDRPVTIRIGIPAVSGLSFERRDQFAARHHPGIRMSVIIKSGLTR